MLQTYPDNIVSLILCEWLDITDIGHLDASHCSAKGRDWWLSMLRSASFFIFESSKMKEVDNYVRGKLFTWIQMRNVLISHLAFPLYIDDQLPQGYYTALLQRIGGHLQSVDMLDCEDTSQRTISLILKYCPNLTRMKAGPIVQIAEHFELGDKIQHIEFTKVIFYEAGYASLAKLRHIRHLHLQQCFVWIGSELEDEERDRYDEQLNAKKFDEITARIVAANPRLEYLLLPREVSPKTLHALSTHCGNLKQLHMESGMHADPAIDVAAFTLLLASCRHITHLTFNVPNTVPETLAAAIAAHCPQLQFLRSCQLTSHGVQIITEGCRALTHLDLSTDNVHPSITKLALERIDDAAMLAIAKNCSELTHVNFRDSHLATETGISAVASACRKLQVFKANRNTGITDTTIATLVRNAHNLSVLHVMECDGVTDAVLYDIATYYGDTLQELAVSRCAQVTDAGIAAIANSCTQLRDFRFSCAISDATAFALARNGSNLKSLLLLQYAELSDVGLTALAEGCSHLQTLDVVECELITDQGLLAIAQRCRRLVTLVLERLPLVTQAGMQTIRDSCPRIAYGRYQVLCQLATKLVSLVTIYLNMREILEFMSHIYYCSDKD